MLSNRALLKTEMSRRRDIFDSRFSSVHSCCEGKADVDINKSHVIKFGKGSWRENLYFKPLRVACSAFNDSSVENQLCVKPQSSSKSTSHCIECFVLIHK